MDTVEIRDSFGVYRLRNRDEWIVSFVESGCETGLPAEAIVGTLVGSDGPEHFDAEHFRPNVRFLEFLHDVIARHAASCPGLLAEAQRQTDGYVYIIDGRTPTPQGEVPPEDIIGVVDVRNGTVGGYQGNPNYQVFTSNGLIVLHPWFLRRLLDEYAKIMEKPT